MLVIWIACVLQLISVSGTIDQEPHKLLQDSLQRVNALLGHIDYNIDIERKLLTEFNGGNYENTPSAMTYGTIANNAVQSNTEPNQNGEQLVSPHLPRQGPEPYNSRNPSNSPISAKIAPRILPEVNPLDTPSPLSEELPKWSFEEDPLAETKSTVTITTTTKPPPPTTLSPGGIVRKEMINTMMEEGAGYSYVFTKGMLKAIVDKEEKDITLLLDTFGDKLWQMQEEGELACMGPLLVTRVKKIWLWSTLIPVGTLKRLSDTSYGVLENRHTLDPEVDALFVTYDNAFLPAEGERLLDTVVRIYDYSIHDYDADAAKKLWRELFKALLAPGDRMKGTFELQSFINGINKAYSTRYPNSRRSEIDNIIDTLNEMIEYNRTPEPSARRYMETNGIPKLLSRRGLGKTLKHIKAKFKKIIRHFIIKHSTLFKNFAKHYERKHRQHLRSKKHHSYRSRHHRIGNKRKRHRKKKKSNNKTEKANRDGNNTMESQESNKTIEEMPNFREHSIQTTPFNTKVADQNMNSLVTEAIGRLPISPSVLTRRFIIKKRGNNLRRHNRLRQGQTKPTSTPKRLRHNKILENILRESSYSNEEYYLKSILNDAMFHGNDTIAIKRNNITEIHNYPMKALISDTDEEFVLKRNIYKVFEATQA